MLDHMRYDLALIAEVKQRPILYDSNKKGRDAKLSEWRKIAFVLRNSDDNIAVRMVKSRWKSLRDTFTKEVRQKERIGNKPKRDWKYTHQMKFLVPFMCEPNLKKAHKRRKKRVTVSKFKPEKIEEDRLEPADDFSSVVHEIVEIPCNYNPKDEIQNFFQAIVETVKKLTPENQVRVQKEIANIVLDSKFWEIPDTKED